MFVWEWETLSEGLASLDFTKTKGIEKRVHTIHVPKTVCYVGGATKSVARYFLRGVKASVKGRGAQKNTIFRVSRCPLGKAAL